MGTRSIFIHLILRLDNSQVIWIGETSTSAVPQVDLFFNYRVNPEDLKDKLKLKWKERKQISI